MHKLFLTCLAATLATPSFAQSVLSLDDSRTEDGSLGLGDIFLGSPALVDAEATLVSAGFTTATSPDFLSGSTSGFDVLFTGLLDVPFTAQEITDIVSFVDGGGGLIALREWGSFGSERDALAAAFGVTYSSSPSGVGGVLTPVLPIVSHPIWDGPAGMATQYDQVFSSSILSGATPIGEHSTDGLTALATLEFGAGRVVFLTDTGFLISGSLAPAPVTGSPSGIVWENMFHWAAAAEPLGEPYCISAANSVSPSGSSISAQGSASLAAANLRLLADQAPDQPALFFFGPDQILQPFGNGFRCVGGMVVRMDVISGSGGVFSYPVDFGTFGPSLANLGTVNFQCWYRDPAAGGANFNLSEALELTFLP